MANPFLKSTTTNTTNKNIVPILSPGEHTNPFIKTTATDTTSVTPTPVQEHTNPFLNNKNTTQQTQPHDLMNPVGQEWLSKPAGLPDEPFNWGTFVKRLGKDLAVSVPMITSGMLQWVVGAHRNTINEGLKIPGLYPGSGDKAIIPKTYTQPSGIGYLPTLAYNMAFKGGVDLIHDVSQPGGGKEKAKAYYQHPILAPLGDIAALAMPLMLASGVAAKLPANTIIESPKAPLYPLAAKEGLLPGKVGVKPSMLSTLAQKAFQKFQESSKGMKFKELTGMLPEQKAYFNEQFNYELAKSDALAQQGRSELYTKLKSFTTTEKESFILNLETAKPKTPEGIALLEKAKIEIPKPTEKVATALDLWKTHAAEGLDYMMKETSGTLFKGGAKSKLLTKSALSKGMSEFKPPIIEEAKNFRAQVKEMGGISEKSVKPYEGIIPKDLIKKSGLPIEEIAKKFNITTDEVVSKLRKFSEMKQEFTNLAVDKMTSKFGYKVPIGEKPGAKIGSQIESARWQPTIQALEQKLGTKFTIDEIKDIFEEPDYFHHTFPKDYQYRTRAYTGPTYKPGVWKERLGAEGYSREPIRSVMDYDWQMIKYKALNEFKDNVFKKFGQLLEPDNVAQAADIKSGALTKYGKGKVLFENPDGTQIKLKTDAVLPRTVANEFNKVFMDTSKNEMFFRTYVDPITNSWKIPVLALSPRWVFNNIMGNFVLNTLGGVGPAGYFDAGVASIKALKSMVEAKKAGSPITFVDALVKQGVPQRVAEGLYRGETGAVEQGATVTKLQKTVRVAKYIPDKVYKFNSTVESFFRSAHYFDKIGKDFTFEGAIKSVNEFLFDYSGLSATQKSVFRRIDPFFAWHKNIVRLAVSYPVKYPGRFMLLSYANKIGTEAYDDKLRAAGVNPDSIPEYYKQMYMLPWKDEEGKNFYISLRGIDPLADISNIGISSLHPIIKTVIEAKTGKKSYNMTNFTSPNRPYGSDEVITPSIWRMILNNFPQFRVIEDVIRPYSIYDTGEPWLTKRGEPIYTKNRLLSILSIMAFKVTPRDIDEIYAQSKQDEKTQQKTKNAYERKLESFKQKHPEKWYTK